MEKYSLYRDESTGIAPFYMPKSNPNNSNKFIHAALVVYSVITTTLAMICLGLYFLVLDKILPEFLAEVVMTWILLIPLRVFNVKLTYENEKKASVRKRSIIKANPGDIILSNFVSPLDAFVYRSFRRTIFAFPTKDGLFEISSAFKAMKRALAENNDYSKKQSLEEISNYAKERNSVVVVFVEGTTSNGKGLLTLKNLDYKNIAKVEGNVFTSAIKYNPQYAASPLPCSLLSYIWNTSCASWWYIANVKISSEPMAKSQISLDLIGKDICRLGHLRLLSDRLDFNTKLEYLNEIRSKRH
ncbi:hypothetical protein DASB73_037080 [Starmerella bacillaris]|uniref:Phospholipid/glycerol acyltransferase domain-containing protein n=1 Tax=Starmerella bacillaris TaxID=1247836 RepID=A0AAV5RMU0_STABA|nr:hypothetical protein DASB73_037080 [Starmerella bacillaris]